MEIVSAILLVLFIWVFFIAPIIVGSFALFMPMPKDDPDQWKRYIGHNVDPARIEVHGIV